MRAKDIQTTALSFILNIRKTNDICLFDFLKYTFKYVINMALGNHAFFYPVVRIYLLQSLSLGQAVSSEELMILILMVSPPPESFYLTK